MAHYLPQTGKPKCPSTGWMANIPTCMAQLVVVTAVNVGHTRLGCGCTGGRRGRGSRELCAEMQVVHRLGFRVGIAGAPTTVNIYYIQICTFW